MEEKKSPFDDFTVTIDEETLALMRIAQNPNLAPIKPDDNINQVEKDVHKFIRVNKIVKGNKKIPGYIVFDAYIKWTELKQVKPTSFSKYFNKVFKPKRTGAQKFYELDPAPFNLPENYSIWTDPVVLERK